MNTKLSVGALTAIVVAIVVGVFVASDADDTSRFNGTLEAVNTACFADGVCSATVDEKTVVLAIGWSTDTVGEVRFADGIGGLEQQVGSSVSVFAAETDEGYTLYGSEEYFIELAR